MRRRGPNAEGSRASGIRHWGGFTYNSSCVWEPEASFMTSHAVAAPRTKQAIGRRGRDACFLDLVLYACAGLLSLPAGGHPGST